MRNKTLMLSLPAFALALSGCARSGVDVRPPPACPAPQPVNPSLMHPPSNEAKVRAILFESPPKPTPKSGRSRRS